MQINGACDARFTLVRDRSPRTSRVMNRMDLGLTGDPRARGLIAAVYASLAS